MPSTLTACISTGPWLVMAAQAFTGQIAWAVENSWFTTSRNHAIQKKQHCSITHAMDSC
jgi:hypothetical protein